MLQYDLNGVIWPRRGLVVTGSVEKVQQHLLKASDILYLAA